MTNTTDQLPSVASHIVPTQEERVFDAMLHEWDQNNPSLTRDQLVALTDLTRQQVSRVISKLKKNKAVIEISLSDKPFDNAFALSQEKLAEYRPNQTEQETNYRKAPRLRLTNKQQNALARTTAKILVDRPYVEFWDAADEAQKVLPESRRRSFRRLRAPNVKRWLVPMVEKEKQTIKATGIPEPKEEEEEVVAGWKEPDNEPDNVTLNDIPVDKLIHELGSRLSVQIAEEVTTRVRAAISRDLQNALQAIEEENQKPTKPDTSPSIEVEVPQTEKVEKPKVLVVGLLNQQQQDVANEFGEFMDLRFHKTEKNSNSKKLPTMASSVDAAIMMTRWMSHAEERQVRGVTDQYIRVSGGVSSLKEELHKFYSGWSSQ